MDLNSPQKPGLLASLQHLGDSLLAALQDRISLVSDEIHEEKFRLIQTFLWISALLTVGVLAITFASLTLVYFFWETHRLMVLGGLTTFYAAAFTWTALKFRGYLKGHPRPLSATLDELASDRECIRKTS